MILWAKVWNDPFVGAEEPDELASTLKPTHAQPPVSRTELVAYLVYSIGNNAQAVYTYFPTLLQYVAYRGGFDPTQHPRTHGCDMTDPFKACHVSFGGDGEGVPVSSMVLYVDALSFFIQFVLFITIGTLADFGQVNYWIVLVSTILLLGTEFAPLALADDDGSLWYIIALIVLLAVIGFGTAAIFYSAAYPLISDNLPVVRYARYHLSKDDSQAVAEHWRSFMSVIIMACAYFGQLVLACTLYGISFLPRSTGPFVSDGRTLGDAAIFIYIGIACCGAFFLVCAIPYLITKPKERRGPPFPSGAKYFTMGWKSVGQALREIRRYRQFFTYIVGYFILNDAVITVNQLMAIIVGQITHFSAQQQTLIGVVFGLTNLTGCLSFYYLSEHFNLPPKTTLLVLLVLDGLMAVYGCIGINPNSTFGFKTTAEVWVYCCWGFFFGPTFAYQITVAVMMMPKGQENMFFGIIGVASGASAWIGPLVVGVIAQKTGNLWLGWPFILAMFVVALAIIYSVDMDVAKPDLASSDSGIMKET